MSRLDDKVADYKAREAAWETVRFSPRERAELETEIWALVPPSERKNDKGISQGRGHWLQKHLGQSSKHYEYRYRLLSVGAAADVLWERIDRDMPLQTAGELLTKARALANEAGEPGALGKYLEAELRAYDALPDARVLPGGKVVRKRGAASLPDLGSGGDGSASGPSGGMRTIWGELRGRLGAYIAERLAGLDPEISGSLYRAFERDLNVLLEEYQAKIDKTRSRAERGEAARTAVTRRQVVDACSVLSMDPPAPGAPLDLRVARRQQRRIAGLYHPDANGGGDASTRASYERVMQAYQRLEEYTEGLVPTVAKREEKKEVKRDGDERGIGHEQG